MKHFVVDDIKNDSEARQCAIEWQNMATQENLSYGELLEWQNIFTKIAKKFNLTEEFKENGII